MTNSGPWTTNFKHNPNRIGPFQPILFNILSDSETRYVTMSGSRQNHLKFGYFECHFF